MRGEILALREKEFVEAAVAQGKGPVRIMVSELLPNIVSTIIVFFTLNIANNICWSRRCRSSARACVRRTRRGAR